MKSILCFLSVLVVLTSCKSYDPYQEADLINQEIEQKLDSLYNSETKSALLYKGLKKMKDYQDILIKEKKELFKAENLKIFSEEVTDIEKLEMFKKIKSKIQQEQRINYSKLNEKFYIKENGDYYSIFYLDKKVDWKEEGGTFTFQGCWDLKGIECDSPFFKSINGVLFTADLKTLVCYPQGKGCDNYVVPDSVTNIAEDAFCSFVSPWTADSCKRITLPKSINEITDTTFEHHKSLKWIECDNEHYKSIDGVLFTADCKTLVYYPRGREDSQYIIPDTVTKIENRAFASNSYLRKIIIPKGRMEDFIEMFPEDNEYELAEA